MLGDPPAHCEEQRYWKFAWNNLDALPKIGEMDYQPKGGALRMFAEGTFSGEHLEAFSPIKQKQKLRPLGCCVYCHAEKNDDGDCLPLTSEHVIPEFLGAGLELPDASCANCQEVTSKFEGAIAQEMFDPVRKSFGLHGKKH